MDAEFGGKNISPNMEYTFIQEIISNYENLKMNFNNGDEEITDKAGWRSFQGF